MPEATVSPTPPPDPADPQAVYAERLAARRAAVAGLAARFDRVGRARVGTLIAAAVAANAGAVTGLFPWWWAGWFGVPFLALFLWGKVLTARRARAGRAVRFYEHGLDRVAGRWAGRGPTGEEHADPAHLAAADLDLFGAGGLFQRVSAARTAGGERRLADWLQAPAPAAEVRARQEAVADLRGRVDLREYLAVAGADVGGATGFAALAAWGADPPRDVERWRQLAAAGLGWFNGLAVLGWLAAGTTAVPVLVGAVLSVVVVWPVDRWARSVVTLFEGVAGDLPLLEAVLSRLEAEPVAAGPLKRLQASLLAGGVSAAARVRELRALCDRLGMRRNPLVVPVAVAILWDVRTAIRFDAWRQQSGPAVGRWLDAVAELEALSSLAGYAFENPGDPFPEVVDGPPRVEADGLAHPLLPAGRGVRNAVRVGGPVPLLVVSGSNMSGKSTLLRAVGVNVALGLAGGPVRADRMTLAPVAVGATMRVQDSLADGKSRFFAEVTRVRAVLDRARAGGPAVLFLFDELFAGTNSADRLVGAEAVLRNLLDAGAVGLVTTHDLALTAAADRLGGRAANVHFADRVGPDGGLAFDYTMRPGVVPHGNGVALMRAVGLDV